MKNIALLLSLFLFITFLPSPMSATDCIPDCDAETDWTLEVRCAYYDLTSKHVKKIYSNSWLDYQVEAAKRMDHFWELWGGVYWASKHGHAHRKYPHLRYAFRDNTKMFILPISFGVKFLYPILPFVDVYAGLGVCYTFLKIKNFCKEKYQYWGLARSPFKKEIHKAEFGGVFKAGFQYAMSDYTFLDVFFDYYLQHFHFSNKDKRIIFKGELDCSGYKCGAGIGVYF